MMQAEPRVDALPEDAPGFRFSIQQQDPLGPLLTRPQGRGHPRGPATDDDDVIARTDVPWGSGYHD